MMVNISVNKIGFVSLLQDNGDLKEDIKMPDATEDDKEMATKIR